MLWYLIWIMYRSSDVLYLFINKKFCKISDCKYFIFNIPRAQPIYSHRSPQRTKLFWQVRRERQEQQLETELSSRRKKSPVFCLISVRMNDSTFWACLGSSFSVSDGYLTGYNHNHSNHGNHSKHTFYTSLGVG